MRIIKGSRMMPMTPPFKSPNISSASLSYGRLLISISVLIWICQFINKPMTNNKIMPTIAPMTIPMPAPPSRPIINSASSSDGRLLISINVLVFIQKYLRLR